MQAAFQKMSEIKKKFDADAARINALFVKIKEDSSFISCNVNDVNNPSISNKVNSEDIIDLDFEFDEGFFNI